MRKIVKHYSKIIELPVTECNGSPFKFDSITFRDDATVITGSAGGKYAAEATKIVVAGWGGISVYGPHGFDNTEHYNIDLVKDFVDFFKSNIDIDFYENQPTNTGMVMLSPEDSSKLVKWANSHKYDGNAVTTMFENIYKKAAFD